MSAIVVRSLRKNYDAFEAVKGIDLTVATGQVFALLGPNGAGKTTTLEILEGFRKRTSGDVDVLGVDPERGGRRLRERIGVVLQDTAVDQYLTVREVLGRNAGYYPRARPVDEVIDMVGLREKADARVKSLSGGQQRRLDVGLGIVGNPELVFLDEPTTGFDPSARRGAWELVDRLTGGGTTVLLTTHYMDEAQALADQVAVIAGGRIVATGSPETIGGRDKAAVRVRFLLPAGVAVSELPLPIDSVEAEVAAARLPPGEPGLRALHALTGWALNRGVDLEGLTVDRPSLEDIYLELTGPAPDSTPDAETTLTTGATR